MSDEFLWVEKSIDQKYRGLCPTNDIKAFFDIKDEIPNMILTGVGTGKTHNYKSIMPNA